jgi:hypothetical protein
MTRLCPVEQAEKIALHRLGIIKPIISKRLRRDKAKLKKLIRKCTTLRVLKNQILKSNEFD